MPVKAYFLSGNNLKSLFYESISETFDRKHQPFICYLKRNPHFKAVCDNRL